MIRNEAVFSPLKFYLFLAMISVAIVPILLEYISFQAILLENVLIKQP